MEVLLPGIIRINKKIDREKITQPTPVLFFNTPKRRHQRGRPLELSLVPVLPITKK